MMKVYIGIMAIMLATCKSNSKGQEAKTKSQSCSVFNDKYIEYVMAEQKDSALYYIDKAITCDPDDDFFKFEKVKLLLKYGNYAAATSNVKDMMSDNSPTYEMLYGIILLKQNNSKAEKVLESAYDSFDKLTKEYEEENSSLQYYKLGLDNYFNGQNYTLEAIEKFKDNYKDQHNIALVDYLKDIVVQEAREDVLYKMFNMN
ncbi:hypothetical protein [Joostella sp. CR20]|uniref:hypothetical protein n=1 Tax=Joostella sp. CR20 TaxID=2804312 RepID=UPI00313CB673